MGSFQNAHSFTLNNGTFIDISSTTVTGAEPLIHLERHTAGGATHDSLERFPPARCHPGTREWVLGKYRRWARDPREDGSKQVNWLFGPAGMGKSAIAQTLAEELEAEGILAASFFFSRNNAQRNTPARFVATIALQFATSIPSVRPHIEDAIKADPSTLTKAPPIQLNKLIIEPLSNIAPLEGNRLVIIDGLDECDGAERKVDQERDQALVLKLVETLRASNPHLFFLICSRPEAWIERAFTNLPSLLDSTEKFDLFTCSDKYRDVARYLRVEFDRIRGELGVEGSWPSIYDMISLVERASGQFIYASTVIRYVEEDDPWHPPQDRLAVILTSAKPPEGHKPLSVLDALYLQILRQSGSCEKVKEIIGCLLLLQSIDRMGIQYGTKFSVLKLLCGWPDNAARGLHSLIADTGHPFYHATFIQFIEDPNRSQEFHILTGYYAPYLTMRCLQHLSSHSKKRTGEQSLYDYINTIRETAARQAFNAARCWPVIIARSGTGRDQSLLGVNNAFLDYDFAFDAWYDRLCPADVISCCQEEWMLENFGVYMLLGRDLSQGFSLLRRCVAHDQAVNDRQMEANMKRLQPHQISSLRSFGDHVKDSILSSEPHSSSLSWKQSPMHDVTSIGWLVFDGMYANGFISRNTKVWRSDRIHFNYGESTATLIDRGDGPREFKTPFGSFVCRVLGHDVLLLLASVLASKNNEPTHNDEFAVKLSKVTYILLDWAEAIFTRNAYGEPNNRVFEHIHTALHFIPYATPEAVIPKLELACTPLIPKAYWIETDVDAVVSKQWFRCLAISALRCICGRTVNPAMAKALILLHRKIYNLLNADQKRWMGRKLCDIILPFFDAYLDNPSAFA